MRSPIGPDTVNVRWSELSARIPAPPQELGLLEKLDHALRTRWPASTLIGYMVHPTQPFSGLWMRPLTHSRSETQHSRVRSTSTVQAQRTGQSSGRQKSPQADR